MQTSRLTSISEAIRGVIIDRGLSAYAVAKMSGVSPVVIQRFVSGERGLSLDTADKIAMNLGLRISEVREEPRDPQAHQANDDGPAAASHQAGPPRLTQLIFSRKIGDAIVIDDGGLIISIDDIASGVVSWRIQKAGVRKPLARESRDGETVELEHGIRFTAKSIGKTSLRLVVVAPHEVTINRFEIFKAMRSARGDRPSRPRSESPSA
jgi:sRNA-binding carbon storage regulator CsrA